MNRVEQTFFWLSLIFHYPGKVIHVIETPQRDSSLEVFLVQFTASDNSKHVSMCCKSAGSI